MTRAAIALVAVLATAGCGSAIDAPPFRRIWPENRLGAVESVLARVGRPEPARVRNATAKPLAVVASEGVVVAHDLAAGRRLWAADLTATSRPFVTAEVVLVVADRDVVALDVVDGQERWRVAVEENLLGAAANADRAFLVFGATPAPDDTSPAGALLCVDLSSGDELWRIDAGRALGAPAVAGDLVLVPWGGVYLSAFAAATGAETLRLRTEDDAIHWVEALPQGIYYGADDGVYRLTARAVAGTKRGQTRFALPQPVPLPVPVPTGRDGYHAPVGAAAADGLRLYWGPVATDLPALPLAGELVYLVTGRYAFALGHADGKLRWATVLPYAPLTGAATEAGLLLVDIRGALVLLGATAGVPEELGSLLPPPVVGAAFDLGAFVPQGIHTEAIRTEPPPPVRTQLALVAMDAAGDDAAAISFRTWAVQVLATLEDPIATADLVALSSRVDLPEPVRAAAVHGLEGRDSGTAPLLDALQARYDWVAGTAPGPVAALAHALARSHEVAAVPLLLEHLDDPATDEVTLAWIAQALGDLGDRAAIEPLFAFLERYHADPALGYRPDALREAARGVLLLGGTPVRARLEAIGRDPHALAFVRDAIGELLQETAGASEASTSGP